MVKQDELWGKIEEWVEEGLISRKQGEALKRREGTRVPVQRRPVQAGEILVYLGSLVVVLALAFLVGLNWELLGSTGQVLSVLLPTLAMLAMGWWLHGTEDPRLRRGAMALWLGACLLSVVAFWVVFEKLNLVANENLQILVSFVLATGLAGAAFVLMPGITQSIGLHLCGSGVLFTFLLWLDYAFPPFDPWRTLLVVLAAGGLWLALAEWLWAKQGKGLVTVSRLVVSLTVLGWITALAVQPYDVPWHKTAMEIIGFLLSALLIVASVKRQSQVFLYGGAGCLLFLIAYVNLEHFADTVGMPVALFIAGVLLIGLGLGTGRLSKRIQVSH
jgi:hypothetical protein